jgi:hypothetical protein
MSAKKTIPVIRLLVVTVSLLLAWLFGRWREGIAEADDVGHFDWRVFILSFGFGLALALIYFIPSLLAARRRHPNATAIFILNFSLGWTFLGWIGALIWAIYRERT